MTYNAKKPKEVEAKTLLPKDSILDGVIVKIIDGKSGDFIKNEAKWDGDLKQPAINITVDVKHPEEENVFIEQIFTYKLSEIGEVEFHEKMNIGKYNKKYSKLPEVGDKVKILTNKDGFGKIKLD